MTQPSAEAVAKAEEVWRVCMIHSSIATFQVEEIALALESFAREREREVWEAVIARIYDEEEMNGQMPDVIWDACVTREGAAEVMRASVRATKGNLIADFRSRLRRLSAEPEPRG